MKEGIAALNRFIQRHSLHASVPVNINALFDIYEVRILPLSHATLGFAYLGPVYKLVGLNCSLHIYKRRMIFCHEVTHGILNHPNSFHLCKVNAWWYNRFELEAQEGAALMLVPLQPALKLAALGVSLRQMQEHFEVPEELVTLRLKMARLTF